MRLIFVTYTLASGGAERVVSILANHFAEKYQTEIICLRHGTMFYKLSPKVKVLFADEMAKGWFSRLIWLRNYVKEGDVVLPFMVKVYCVVLLALLGRNSIVIASERNDPRTTQKRWKIMRRLLLPSVTSLVVQTQYIKEYFPDNIQKKIKIILNPVDLQQCSKQPWSEKSRTVLALGRTDQQKNYPMMIRAFHRFHKDHSDFKLDIWGSRQPEKDTKLHSLIKQLNAEDYIHIHGKTNDVASLYAQAYMFVMSSYYEGLSNSLIEALCSGLPVVSTKVSGAIDLISEGNNGLLVESDDEDGFYFAMKDLAENKEKSQQLAENAIKIRGSFDVNVICNEWDKEITRYSSN